MRLPRTTTLMLLLALLMRSSAGQTSWDCDDTPCKCKWISGKKTADCNRQNFTQVPKALSSEIQNLDLTGNTISRLTKNAFSEVNLVNLHKLIMRDCGIQAVHTDAFNGLEIVIEIDLSGNNIKSLSPGTFDETLRLRVLYLTQNRLKVLENGLFHNLAYLQKVSLTENNITRISEQTFYNLPQLHTLTLDANNLTTLKVATFKDFPKLGSLELNKNHWNCDCHLKQFRDWTIQRNLYTKPTTCDQPPSMAGKMWDEASSDDFACKPKILTIGPEARMEIGQGDARLWCRAAGIPRPEINWVFRSRVINNSTRRHSGDRKYLLSKSMDWTNLTIPDVTLSDKGEYVCVAKNPGGINERNITLIVLGDAASGTESMIALPLIIGLGVVILLFVLMGLTFCFCYCRRRRTHHSEKNAEAASLDHHGLGEQEKSLITAINPVVKPPRRYEAPSVTSHGTEMTELNRTLLDNDSVFADGIGSVIGVLPNGLNEEERERATPELDGNGTLPRGTSYRQYPPDLLAFPGGRGSSPTSQASTAPDSSRLPNQQLPVPFGSPSSPYSAGFKTLPHPARASSTTPYSTGHPVLPRHGYVTIPRRPRAPSWSSGPPTSPTEILEPVYDNLGLRTTADGSSVLSLNKSPEPAHSMRGRPLPCTPTTSSSVHFNGPQRAILSSPHDRSAPEGAAEWPTKLSDEMDNRLQAISQTPGTLGRKVPPRPPPKPKKKVANGPLYEDEGEDGTEV